MLKPTRYYQVSNLQLFIAALAVGIIASAIVTINILVMDYLSLPEVIMRKDECTAVINYANGDAYTCADVGVILRKYRPRTT